MLQIPPPELPRPTDPVEQPIINSPFHPPQYHWDLDTSAKAPDHVLDGRRSSQDIPPRQVLQKQSREEHRRRSPSGDPKPKSR